VNVNKQKKFIGFYKEKIYLYIIIHKEYKKEKDTPKSIGISFFYDLF